MIVFKCLIYFLIFLYIHTLKVLCTFIDLYTYLSITLILIEETINCLIFYLIHLNKWTLVNLHS